MTRSLAILTLLAILSGPVAAQDRDIARQDYFRAVATFFNLPPNEIAILSDWQMPADEIPVVLFMARRAGVSPEALVALRDSGRGWSALADRYTVQSAAFHVPVADDAPTGRLEGAYRLFRSTPVGEWGTIELSDEDIVGLVNVRVISQSLRMPAERVLAETAHTGSFLDLYVRLKR
ncbi:MAG: hypothetical protein HKN72_04285 [Gemmatimonadetes bacterium]|nr:hypothetical protein [Gemmatimonadota bacterium]NNF12412.1 hypothetical protein [Gemmatimonadota bacterium]NNL30192.1 hypothetical protein [Gemmatimonadota bacterium]